MLENYTLAQSHVRNGRISQKMSVSPQPSQDQAGIVIRSKQSKPPEAAGNIRKRTVYTARQS
jgi:hypothetical protein